LLRVKAAQALESSEMLEAVMVQYGPYEYCDNEVLKLTEYLKNCARQQKVVHYDDAYDAVRQFGVYHGPHDQRLWHLLALISETEVSLGRHALSAIVAVKSGDGANRPGTGFFELEKMLNRYRADDDTTWLAELDGLFKYWAKH
jgi:hypothetical protein